MKEHPRYKIRGIINSATILHIDGATINIHLLFTRLDSDPRDARPRQLRLYELIRKAILDNTLAAGTHLPATRVLAVDLGVARNSVLYAYERLAAEGFISANRHGTRVLPVAQIRISSSGYVEGTIPSARARKIAHPRDFGSEARAFNPGSPDCAAFPRRQWLACLNSAWKRAEAKQLGYGNAAGAPALRTAIAEYLRSARGVRCTAGQVFVTAGSQAGLDVCARVLADADSTAWVENPGYRGVRTSFELAGLKIHPVSVDDHGMAPTETDWKKHPPKLIHVTPSQQFPLGVMLGLQRRLEMIRRSAEGNAWIIEDDYDSEFCYEGRPLAAMQGLVENAPVIYVGTFSRMMFPSLRLGYLVVPPALAATFDRISELTWAGHAIEQGALAEFISSGKLATHVRNMKRLYGERRTILLQSLKHHLAGQLEFTAGAGGLHLTVLLKSAKGVTDVDVANRALGLGLTLRPLSLSSIAGGGIPVLNGFVLGFAAVPERKIEPAVKKLALAIKQAR